MDSSVHSISFWQIHFHSLDDLVDSLVCFIFFLVAIGLILFHLYDVCSNSTVWKNRVRVNEENWNAITLKAPSVKHIEQTWEIVTRLEYKMEYEKNNLTRIHMAYNNAEKKEKKCEA